MKKKWRLLNSRINTGARTQKEFVCLQAWGLKKMWRTELCGIRRPGVKLMI
jgi:hypothetical protein